MTGQEIVLFLQSRGYTLRTLPNGTLEVWPESALHPLAKGVIRQHEREILIALGALPVAPWRCPGCDDLVRFWSASEHAHRFWWCTSCDVWGAVPDGTVYPRMWANQKTAH